MGFVDPARVAVTGLSHGSEMVKYAVSRTNLFRAAIASGPSWEPMLYELTTDFYRQYMSRTYDLESPDGEARVRWQRTSAALNADRIRAALLDQCCRFGISGGPGIVGELAGTEEASGDVHLSERISRKEPAQAPL